MRNLRSLAVATFAITIFMLCSATGAFAGQVTSLNSSFTQDPFDPSSLTVNASMTQSEPESSIEVTLFVVPEWDQTCSEAGAPSGGIDPFTSYMAGTGFTSAASDTFSVGTSGLPAYVGFCVGAQAYDGTTYTIVAQHLHFGPPQIDIGSETTGKNQIDVPYIVYPQSLATTHWMSYFKKVNTTDCSNPDGDDLATAQDTTHQTISSDLENAFPIDGSITGLETESDYCIAFLASNSAGTTPANYWSYETKGDVPTIANTQYSATASSISYDTDVTPGANRNDTTLLFQYFKKTGADCSDVPDPMPGQHYHDFGSPALGYDPINATGTITGLDVGVTYCIRAIAINLYGGSDPIEFSQVSTTAPANATIDNLKVEPGDTDPELRVDLSDGGAFDGNGNQSNYYVSIHKVTADRCNADDFYGGDTLLEQDAWFDGNTSLDIAIDGLVPGETYCAQATINSSWGDAYDANAYQSFVVGAEPTVTNVTGDPSLNSITYSATVHAGFVESKYGVGYQAKPPATACSALTSGWEDEQQTVSTGLSSAQTLSITVNSLDPDTDYCARFYALNDWGAFASAAVTVRTDAPDTTAPSVPTGLTVTNASHFSWNASTDSVGVTGYKFYKDGVLVGSPNSTAFDLVLACGTSASMTVAARDAAGNVSAQSAPLVVAGESCPSSPPADQGGGGSTPAVVKPSLGTFPASLAYKTALKTAVPLSCPSGCTLQLQLSGFGKTAKPTEISVAAGATSAKLKFKFQLPSYTPSQLSTEWKKKVGKKPPIKVPLTLSVTAVNSAGKSATKKIKLTIK